jgi:hypothetical protein
MLTQGWARGVTRPPWPGDSIGILSTIPLLVELACNTREVADQKDRPPPWLTGSYHPSWPPPMRTHLARAAA